jgi:hypothetical protein
MAKLTPIPVDEAIILAAYKASNAANAHAIGEAVEQYRRWCRRGIWQSCAREWQYALILLTRGETTNAREAWNKAGDHFFDLRKEEVRATGRWHKDWDEFLGGPSPDRRKTNER